MRPRGFTLIELLVAMSLFAIFASLAYGGMNNTLAFADILENEQRRWKEIELFLNRFESDISNAANLPVRDQYNRLAAPFEGDSIHFVFTRLPHPLSTSSGPQRIGYRYEDGQLFLMQWPALNVGPRIEPNEYLLFTNLHEVTFDYLDTRGLWRHEWRDQKRPRALRLTLAFAEDETITRLVALP